MSRRRWFVPIASVLLITASVSVLAFSVKEEVKLGTAAAAEVEKEMPPSKNAQWQSDIDAMGQRFMPYLTRKDFPYSFKIVDAKDQINAFSLPGGFVYFTERMWRIMTPDERAAVMAHEIIHCDKRHGVDQMLKSQQRALWMLPLIVASGGAAAELILLGNMAISQRYSQKMERQADELGIQLLAKAGYDPAGSVTSMKKLLNLESDTNRYEVSAIFASHPETLKRINYLTDAALKLGAKPQSLELKAVDDPDRLGNITAARVDNSIVSASTTKPLERGQKVLIKKMLWDDDARALRPKTIMTATVLTPGKLPLLTLRHNEEHVFAEVMAGDGVYPAESPPAPTPAASEGK